MTADDKRAFAELLLGLAEIYGREFSKAGMRLWWEDLADYDLADVRAAFQAHRRDTTPTYSGALRGERMPTTTTIIAMIDGPKPTADQVLAAALKPTTPLGVLCRIEIGSWNLGNLNSHQLKPYAEQCLARLDEWRARLAANDLAPNELDAMKRLGVEMGNRRALTAHQPRNITSAPQLTESAA